MRLDGSASGIVFICVSRVSRFAVSRDDPQRADPDSEQILMRIPQTYANHNGGSILFGRDGYLYIGLGDGGGHNDPFGHGQNLSTWLGSVLRIDVDAEQEGLPYAIPPDNPFIDRPASKPEIYAYGLRNVWRLSKTGRRVSCGPATWARICGRKSTSSAVEATTVGVDEKACTHSTTVHRRPTIC